jgi:hypothetical protein
MIMRNCQVRGVNHFRKGSLERLHCLDLRHTELALVRDEGCCETDSDLNAPDRQTTECNNHERFS